VKTNEPVASIHTTEGGNLHHGPGNAQDRATPRVGYLHCETAVGLAETKHLVAHTDQRFASGPVAFPDGSWGYWTAHGPGLDGWVLLPGGRCIKGAAWAQWESGMVLDARYPTIWTNLNCHRPWAWQLNQYGHLTRSGW